MSRLIIDRRGIKLEYEADILILREPGKGPRTVPLSRISQVICMHNVGLTTQLIGQLQARGIDFITMNGRHPGHGFGIFADQQRDVARRCLQYEWQNNHAQRLILATSICRHKFRAFLKVMSQPCLKTQSAVLNGLAALNGCSSTATLRGIEGRLQRVAFDYWKALLPEKLGFIARKRRSPQDPVNALLSLGYTLVFNEAVRQCKKFGLDPALGFYHKATFGRNSLACDVMEPTRPYVERFVHDIFKQDVLKRSHFSLTKKGCYLGKQGRVIFYQQFDMFLAGNRRRIESPARWIAQQLNMQIEKGRGNEH